jgi:glycosyltransferase involved in cell wall biosynthesis
MTDFSLIVPTVQRTIEFERLLYSLENQGRTFQLIIVDQNRDDRLWSILRTFESKFDIVHIASRRGAARARNAGLDVATADIITFPDDDSWYPPDLLQRIHQLLHLDPDLAGLCVRGADAEGRDAGLRWSKRPAVINRFNVWRASTEWTMFLRRSAVTDVRFDEKLGVGAETPWGSGEGTDFLLRILARGNRVRYEPSLVVHHPSHHTHPRTEQKVLSYARGLGRVLALNGYSRPMAAILCFGPLLHAAEHMARLDPAAASLQLRTARHRWKGFSAPLE